METINRGLDKLDLMARLVESASRARGIETSILEIDLDVQPARNKYWLGFTINGHKFCYAKGALLEYGKNRWGGIGRNLNHEAALLIADKYKTKVHLQEKGFSVPKGKFFRRRKLELALKAFDEFHGPICVKPNNGSEGNLVHTSIRDRENYVLAIERVTQKYPNILIEESVEGSHFRFFYVYPKVVGVRCGIPMNVVGDGKSNIQQLVENKNSERKHRDLPTHPPLEIDDEVLSHMAIKGLTFDHIPALSETVFLRGVSNGTAGADTTLFDLDQVHPSYLEIVAEACKSVDGLRYSGADIVIRDITQPAAPGNHWLLELNASPAITGFYFPWEGNTVDVAGHVLDLLLASYPFDS